MSNEEEEYLDDEDQENIIDEDVYITEENDPQKVLIVPADEYVTTDNEEKIEFDEIFETVRAKITDFVNYDRMMEKKVLDYLKRGNYE